jgi:hypothetical protein
VSMSVGDENEASFVIIKKSQVQAFRRRLNGIEVDKCVRLPMLPDGGVNVVWKMKG